KYNEFHDTRAIIFNEKFLIFKIKIIIFYQNLAGISVVNLHCKIRKNSFKNIQNKSYL
ncbi:hypothetical protein H311_01302, partial [Anncaliia algerae PRA109]